MNRMSLRQKLAGYLSHCKDKWQDFHDKLHYLWRNEFARTAPHSSASLDDLSAYQNVHYEPQILRAIQWTLEEEIDDVGGVEVEVEFYPEKVEVELHQTDPYPSATLPQNVSKTIERKNFLSNEEVNRRITHFPPSHRLH